MLLICSTPKKRTPAAPQGGSTDDYKLRYDLPKKPGDDEIAKNAALYGGAGGVPAIIAPISVKSSRPPAKATYLPPDKNKHGNPLIPMSRLVNREQIIQ